jgi:hypothetical protein
MKIKHAPITGKEEKDDLAPSIRALSEFYQALNRRNLDKMAGNWAHTEDAVMDNPLVASSAANLGWAIQFLIWLSEQPEFSGESIASGDRFIITVQMNIRNCWINTKRR